MLERREVGTGEKRCMGWGPFARQSTKRAEELHEQGQGETGEWRKGPSRPTALVAYFLYRLVGVSTLERLIRALGRETGNPIMAFLWEGSLPLRGHYNTLSPDSLADGGPWP